MERSLRVFEYKRFFGRLRMTKIGRKQNLDCRATFAKTIKNWIPAFAGKTKIRQTKKKKENYLVSGRLK